MMILHPNFEVHGSTFWLPQFCFRTQFRLVMHFCISPFAWLLALLQSLGFFIEYSSYSAFCSHHCTGHPLCLIGLNTNDHHNASQCDIIVFLLDFARFCLLQPHICCNSLELVQPFRSVWHSTPTVSFLKRGTNLFVLVSLTSRSRHWQLHCMFNFSTFSVFSPPLLRLPALLEAAWEKWSSCHVFVDFSSPVSPVGKTRPIIPNSISFPWFRKCVVSILAPPWRCIVQFASAASCLLWHMLHRAPSRMKIFVHFTTAFSLCLLLVAQNRTFYQPFVDNYTFFFVDCLCEFCLPPFNYLPVVSRCFDSTLGYPGEGPSSKWTCCTANIDAIQTHPDCLEWDFDVSALQETRINQSIHKQVSFDLGKKCKTLIHGGLLIPKKTKANTYVTPHGGVAILSNKALTRAFSLDDDSTGLWSDLASTTRITAAWIQVLPKVRVLVFSFYGETSRHDNSHLRVNDFYLEKIFAIASQFGDVPILVCGDFQADPDTYTAVTSAKQHGRWIDPLTQHDQHGNSLRPITFSRNAVFDNPTEYFSSIDSIIVNRTASFALTSVAVDYSRAKQHAPIIAEFAWPKIFIQGTVLNVPAPLNLENLPKKENSDLDLDLISSNAKHLWDTKFEPLCSSGDDSFDWNNLNKFAIETLTQSGACFKKGLATRAQPPTFSTTTPCPGQSEDGCALTKAVAELLNFHRQLVELSFRLSRNATNDHDFSLTRKLHLKILRKASCFKLSIPYFNEFLTIAQVKNLQKQVCDIINKKRDKSKRERIRNWKQKMIFGTKTKNVHTYVYKWIKSKTQVEVPNLIVDAAGNVLYNPPEAIEEINSQWDKVFSANVLHQDPMHLLHFIWPYIDEVRSNANIPELTGQMLRQQVLRRKANAAAGIDGWRTVEMFSLPVFVYDQVATFFRGIEDGTRSMPKQLATAKQVLLNKNGLDDPMQKRIISLLPIWLLAYTGARFRQLQTWQQNVFPSEIKGGIKGRCLSEIPNNLRLCIDSSKESNSPLIGIKLDKSKCFDRIVYSIAATLLLGFGCPKKVVTFFMGIYSTLTRFLCYKQWCSDRPTTSSNGVVQGCSFSLLAINAYMSAWALFIKKIPHIQFAAYIDDCYLWSNLQYLSNLEAALDVTDKWDDLTGQKLNKQKCQAFATTASARKQLRQHFPEVDHSHVITVLGANLNVTNNKKMAWPDDKTQKILRDIKSIRAIPCSRDITAHLIATKVIPQLNYLPSLNFIPKKALQSVQDEIATSLWKNRPLWRSRWLVLGCLSAPHRNEPFLARAFSCVLETISFLKTTSPGNRSTWDRHVNSPFAQPNSLLASFMQACTVLGISIRDSFTLQIDNLPSIYLPILDCTKRDVKKLLCNLCRHQCYLRACKTVRKDTRPANAIFDMDITKAAHGVLKDQLVAGMRLSAFRDSTIVGCTITKDRCFKVGFTDEASCRFCGFHKETMQHLASECPSLPGDMTRPTCPELGPNFEILGVAEVNHSRASKRLQISDPHKLHIQPWSPSSCCQVSHVWTDGSCELSHMFWHTVGGYAIIDCNDCIIDSGEVFHFALTSFSCELWAVVVAFVYSEAPLCIHSDCDSLVQMINRFPDIESIPTEWPHFSWFTYLFQIFQIRKNFCANPLILEWCPSHILENVPWFEISDAAARQFNTTVCNIWHNRTADRIAKRAVKNQLGSLEYEFSQMLFDAITWQKWLVHIAVQLALTRKDAEQTDAVQNVAAPLIDNQSPLCIPSIVDITPEHPLSVFKYFLPKWSWDQEAGSFDWASKFPDDLQPSSWVSISQENWQIAIEFYKTLTWKIDDCVSVSYIELAYHFHFSQLTFSGIENNPSCVSTILRKVINQAIKIDSQFPLVIGTQKAGCLSKGKTIPAGFLQGSRPLLNIQSLKLLAVRLLHGRKPGLVHWKTSF